MSGNSSMNSVLKGVVRDHRLPADYNYQYTQPYNSRAFLKNLKRFFVTRQLTKQNITIPLYALFVSSKSDSNVLGFHAPLYDCTHFLLVQDDR
jgi:hypothetical protein